MPAAGGSDGCGCTGIASNCRSEWPWLQRRTTRSTRCTLSPPLQLSQKTGTRADLTRGERQAPLLEVRPQGLPERHTGVGFELVLDPVVPQMAEQLVEVVAPALAVFQASSPAVEYFAPAPAVFQASSPVVEHIAPAPAVIPPQRLWWSILHPRQLLFKRQRLWWVFLTRACS